MGHGADQHNRALAMRCAKLQDEGMTHRAIAGVVGKRPEQIKALVQLGQRLIEGNVKT